MQDYTRSLAKANVALDKTKGAIKDTAGKITSDKKLQTEGKLDKAKGAVRNAAGQVKDAFRGFPH